MIKLISLDLWDTLITDGHTMERERDEKRADFILRELHLPETYKEKIMNFFTELVASFKCPAEKNEWAILPQTQLEYLFKLLDVKVSDETFEKILKFYTEEALDKPPRLIETDIKETLAKFKEKYKLSLISNTGRTPGRVLRVLLKEAGIIDFFDVLVFSDEVHLRKPNAQIFLLTCERAGVKCKEAVHIGDSVTIDFLGARDAGMKPIQFLPDERAYMTPFVRSLKEVESVLRNRYDTD